MAYLPDNKNDFNYFETGIVLECSNKNATCKQVLRSPKGKESPLKRHSLHTPLNFHIAHYPPKKNIARLHLS